MLYWYSLAELAKERYKDEEKKRKAQGRTDRILRKDR